MAASTAKKRKATSPPPKKQPGERKNTAVYVSSLPLDATVDEVAAVFSRCGVIAEEIDGRNPRIKLYTTESGDFKGDALIVYFRPESVQLAIQMLDDTDFRLGQAAPTGKMSVKQADMSYKRVRESKEAEKPQEAGDGVMKSRNKQLGHSKDKAKIKKKTEKLNACVSCGSLSFIVFADAHSLPGVLRIGTTMIRRLCMPLALAGKRSWF